MESKLAGKTKFNIAGKDYEITLEEGDDATKIGDKLAAAINGKIDDGLGGKYKVTNATGTLHLKHQRK